MSDHQPHHVQYTLSVNTHARERDCHAWRALSLSLFLPPFFSFSSSKRSRQNRPTDRPTDRDLSLLWVMSPLCVVVVLGHRPRNRTARDHGGRKREDKHEAGNDMRGGGVLRSCVCTFRFRAGWRLHSVRQGQTRTGSVGMETLPCNITIAVEAEHSQLHFMHHGPRIVITKAKEALRESGLWSVLYKPQQS